MPKQLSTTSLPIPATSSRHWLKLLRQLSRAELSAMVALSALTGQLFAAKQLSAVSLLVTLSTLLLAAGCSALNQWQEQDLDARMTRTCQRPLPSGSLAPSAALIYALCCIFCGLFLLYFVPGLTALLLGLLSAIWYNAIYTPLKRRSPFAALPGAICGALPPLIGWTATGAPLLSAEVLILSGTLFLWQIPHSWLLLCHHRNDLQRSGLPDLFQRISTKRLLQINNCWLVALGLCYLLFSLFGLIASSLLSLIFLVGLSAIGLAILFTSYNETQKRTPLHLFHLTNLSMALLLTTLLLDNCGWF